jgi:hypothetical protein
MRKKKSFLENFFPGKLTKKKELKEAKETSLRCNKRSFPSSLLTVFTREFAHVSYFWRKRTVEARFPRRSTKCRAQDNDDGFSHSPRLKQKKNFVLHFLYCFFIVSGQLTTNWRKIGKVTILTFFAFFFVFNDRSFFFLGG